MKRIVSIVAAMGCGLAGARAQTHAVKKPETVVRAIAVYEWTGDEAKPSASRVVPVSIFIDSQFEDAGIYLARPVPMALDRGTVFEVQQSGVPEGTLEVSIERHLAGTSHTPFDDGWLGQGAFKPAAQEPVVAAKKSNRPLPQVVASGGSGPKMTNRSDSTTTADDSNKPAMKRRDGDTTDAAATASSGSTDPVVADDDPNRPVLVRRAGSESGSDSDASQTASTSSTGTASTADADGPTMQKRTDSGDTTADSADVDRPTLKKRTPQQQAQNQSQKRKGDTASVTTVGSLNDDPDRPTLHRGSADGIASMALLLGVPSDMHQMVAVSDAKDRPQHDFYRQWESSQERADVMGKMQAVAQAQLAKYDGPPSMPAPADTPPVTAKAGAKGKKTAAVEPPPPPPAPPAAVLADESLKGYTLSYGGAATFVYSASSPGTAGATRYVTIVAQRETLGELKVALASVTDSNHMDRTPWMRLVDVVDAEASNRASLLFEMRGQTARQFALYRVIGARAEQIFLTGTTE